MTVLPPDPIPPTVAWNDGAVELIDQRRLPAELRRLRVTAVADLIVAIRDLAVRGAPALGAVGAFGVALAAASRPDLAAAGSELEHLRAARPTAVNLAWGVDQGIATWHAAGAGAVLGRAEEIAAADVAGNRALGAAGAALLAPGARVLTHCNAGALACVGYGTALGVVRAAHEQGRGVSVWVDETRPVLQGSRLTAWELERLGIPYEIVVDAAAGSLFAAGRVDAVIVGADRIAANGDFANKIGTYPLAVLADAHGVPFYVAAPVTTVDPGTPDGGAIRVELRSGHEVVDVATAPATARVHNPAFDVTPARLVTALITDRGVIRAPGAAAIATLGR